MGSPPDYNLSMMNVETQQKNHRVGAGWNNDDGSISLTINLGVIIDSNPDIRLRLFPNEYKEEAKPAPKKTRRRPTKKDFKDEWDKYQQDDIPF